MSKTIILNSGARGFAAHPRTWRDYRLCYPVISRRSRGLSVGVNLNPDRVCNFDCVYCEVDRQDFRPGQGKLPLPPKNAPRLTPDLDEIGEELSGLLGLARSGAIWQEPEFQGIDPALRRLNDIAFSGDGEPTTYPHFAEAVERAMVARREAGYSPNEVKLVLITNATSLHRPVVRAGLKLMMEAGGNGEIWAKLDAGTAEYYDRVDKTNVPFERVLRNLRETARLYPLNIQTCFLRMHGEGPDPAQVEAYCDRLNELQTAGGKLLAVQLYTVARRPPHEWVTSLPQAELDAIAATVHQRTGLNVETFGGNIGL